jgi:nucleoside-diphosphate-sugar epimerase
MATVVIGGAGFLGRRLVPLLVERGETVVYMDLAPTEAFDGLGDGVRFVRGDVRSFDDVAGALSAAPEPRRVVNLAYTMGGDRPPHEAFRLNVAGMEHCFEAARLAGAGRVVFASSLAVSGAQHFFGMDHAITEDDVCHGTNQYATHKIFNEGQARDYRAQHGMEIVAIRPANVTGADKRIGSMDHVLCITEPARGRPVSFPYRDAMRCPIHVDDVAEIFARVTLADALAHPVYNTGGDALSLGEIAELVRKLVPDAQIAFERETGGRELASNPLMDCWLVDDSRLRAELGIERRPFGECVRQIVDDVRREEGLPQLHQ